jgi:hypothetical protein
MPRRRTGELFADFAGNPQIVVDVLDARNVLDEILGAPFVFPRRD